MPNEPIVWEAPPPPHKGRGSGRDYSQFISELRTNPGRWAILPGDKHFSTTVTDIRRGKRGFTEGQFEATARSRDEKGRVTIYVRYVGESR